MSPSHSSALSSDPTKRRELTHAWLAVHYRSFLGVPHGHAGFMTVHAFCGIPGCTIPMPGTPEGVYDHWLKLHPDWIRTTSNGGQAEVRPDNAVVNADLGYGKNLSPEEGKGMSEHEKLLAKFYEQREEEAREAKGMQEQYHRQYEFEAQKRWEQECTEWEVKREKEALARKSYY